MSNILYNINPSSRKNELFYKFIENLNGFFTEYFSSFLNKSCKCLNFNERGSLKYIKVSSYLKFFKHIENM